jgi:hypothetical protein
VFAGPDLQEHFLNLDRIIDGGDTITLQHLQPIAVVPDRQKQQEILDGTFLKPNKINS